MNRNLTLAEWRQCLGDEPYRKTCADLPIGTDFLDNGRKLAAAGKLEEAIALLREARNADPSLIFNPDSEARKFAAVGLIDKGKELAKDGKVQEASSVFRKAKGLDSSLTLDPDAEAGKLEHQE